MHNRFRKLMYRAFMNCWRKKNTSNTNTYNNAAQANGR